MVEQIRQPTIEDAEALGRMHHAAWREAYPDLVGEAWFTPQREAARIEGWRTHLAAEDSAVLVRIATRDGAVVGHAVAAPSWAAHPGGGPVRDRELESMYVLASEYGTGLAARLLDAVLGDAPAQLWVFEANPRARAFYAKHGFAPDGARHLNGPELGDQPEIRMVR